MTSPRRSSGRSRVTLAALMALIAGVSVVLGAVRAGDIRALQVFQVVTALALPSALIATRGRRGGAAAFAFGFATFGLVGWAILAPWNWLIRSPTGSFVTLGQGVPGSDALYDLANRLAGPAPSYPPGTPSPTNYDFWANRVSATYGLLAFSSLWVWAILGGLVGVLVRPRSEDGAPR